MTPQEAIAIIRDAAKKATYRYDADQGEGRIIKDFRVTFDAVRFIQALDEALKEEKPNLRQCDGAMIRCERCKTCYCDGCFKSCPQMDGMFLNCEPASDEEWFIPLVDHIQSSGYKHDAYSIVETIVDSASRRGAKEAIEGIIEKTNSYLDLLKRDTNRESCMDCYQLLREQLNELKKKYDAS